jgi:DNA-binding response OmpR family regulator
MCDPEANDTERQVSVLIVEDEFFIGMELQAALMEGGFRVLGPAASVRDALSIIADECPHAAVLDFNLGREKVTPVALILRSLGVPFVLASATAATELANYEVLASVPNLGKPTDLKLLLDAVRAMPS